MALSLRDINEPAPSDTSAGELPAQAEYLQLAGSSSTTNKSMDGIQPSGASSSLRGDKIRLRATGVRPSTTMDVRGPEQAQSLTATQTRSIRDTDWRAVALSVQDNVVQTLNRQRSQQALAQREQEKEFKQRQAQIKKPSKAVYYLLISLSVVVDVLGLLTFTVIGAIVVQIINIIASIFFFIAGLWLGKKIKNTRVSGEGVAKIVANAEQRIAMYRKNIAAIVRFARRSAAGRSILRSSIARKGITWASRGLKWFNSPTVKRALPLIAELIPIMNTLPWYTINMVLTYREHTHEYKLSLQSLEAFPPKVQEESVAFAELHYNQLLQGATAIKGALQRWTDANNALRARQRASSIEAQPPRLTPVRDIVPA